MRGWPEWLPSPDLPDLPDWLASRPKTAVVCLLASVVILGRVISGLFGLEQVAGVRIVLFYFPLAVALGGALVWAAHVELAPQGRNWRTWLPLLAPVGVGLLLLAVPAITDKGAMIVLFVPMTAAVAVAVPSVSRFLVEHWKVFGLGLVALIGVRVGVGMAVDHVLPDTRSGDTWEVQEDRAVCPVSVGRDLAPLEIEGTHVALLGWSNVPTRVVDWFAPGAADRVGSREGARVFESMSILERYAQGPAEVGIEGAGFLSVPIRRYGPSEVKAQLFDGVPSVLVAAEAGTLGVIGLLGIHLLFAAWVMRALDGTVLSASPVSHGLEYTGVAAGLIAPWTALYMFAGNFGLLPLTGQSTPLLAVQSGADLLMTPILWMVTLACASHIQGESEDE